jgi:hypothetical protein
MEIDAVVPRAASGGAGTESGGETPTHVDAAVVVVVDAFGKVSGPFFKYSVRRINFCGSAV